MRCLEFRRAKMADPRAAANIAREHREECSACNEFERQIDGLEARIVDALEVPVPEGFADQSVLRTRQFVGPSRRSARVAWLAAASLVAMLLMVAWRRQIAMCTHDLLVAHAHNAFIAHVEEEPDALAKHESHSDAELDAIFSIFGGKLRHSIGVVRYTGRCTIGGAEGRHLVLDTPEGTVTVLFSSEPRVSIRTVAMEKGWSVIEVPVPRGTMAIVAHSPADAAYGEQAVAEGVTWGSG